TTWAAGENTPWSTFVLNSATAQATRIAADGQADISDATAHADADKTAELAEALAAKTFTVNQAQEVWVRANLVDGASTVRAAALRLAAINRAFDRGTAEKNYEDSVAGINRTLQDFIQARDASNVLDDFTISVISINDAPVAGDQSFSTDEDTPAS